MKPESLHFWARFLLLVPPAALLACAKPTPSSMLISRLDGRGAVAVSPDNPYLAANMLLAKEIEAHEEVRGFFEKRGMPSAIRVEDSIWSPTIIHVYYPEKRHKFEMEHAGDSWIFNGPYNIPKVDVEAAAAAASGVASDTRKGSPLTPAVISVKPPPPALPSTANAAPSTGGAPTPVPTPPPFRSPLQPPPVAFDDLVKEAQGAPAELSPRGDLVHYVTFPGENLSMIARWYTFDKKNSEAIARINRLTKPNMLNVGDTIVIPNYLLKNRARLTERAVNIFRREVAAPAS